MCALESVSLVSRLPKIRFTHSSFLICFTSSVFLHSSLKCVHRCELPYNIQCNIFIAHTWFGEEWKKSTKIKPKKCTILPSESIYFSIRHFCFVWFFLLLSFLFLFPLLLLMMIFEFICEIGLNAAHKHKHIQCYMRAFTG